MIAARTNSIAARINAVDSLLTRMVDSKATLIIDPDCKELIAALRGGYRYKLKTTGEVGDKPEKNKHSHVADAFQYACLHADGNLQGEQWRTKARPVEKVNYVWA